MQNNYQNFNIKEVKIESVESFLSEIYNDGFQMFRGESNSKWSLNSSMVRHFIEASIDSFVLNFEVLEKSVSEFYEVYKRRISNRHLFIRFLFYLQHSVQFSPFIDVTRDLWIALKFALEEYEKSKDVENLNDIAIYGIKLHDNIEEYSNFSKQRDVGEIVKGLSIGINKSNLSKDKVEAYVIDLSDLNIVNDRMLLQKGAFLLLNNYSINQSRKSHQKHINKEVEITKFIISKEILSDLHKQMIDKNPDYLQGMNDPYSIFEDAKVVK